jgi:hypothetical protein
MTRVFISYRTGDDNFAAALLDGRLSARFGAGNVFRDSRHLAPGVDFEPELWRNLAGCSVVVAVIGPRWLTGSGTTNRLQRPTDFVRRELELALRLDLPIVPLLLDDTARPDPSDLPDSLVPLIGRQETRIRARSVEADLQAVVDRLDREYGDEPATRPGTIALLRAETGPTPEPLTALIRKSTADAGVPMAVVAALPYGVQVVLPEAGRAVAMAGDYVRTLDAALCRDPAIGPVRAAMHYGEIAPAPDEALRVVRQLVAEPGLDGVLRATAGARMVLVISDDFHQVAIKPGHRSIDKTTYQRIRSGIGDAWVRVPGFPAARGLAPYVPPAPEAVSSGPVAHFQIDTVHGDAVGTKIVNQSGGTP